VSDHIPEEVRQRIGKQAGDRCGYCLSPQHLVLGQLEIEHLLPRSRGGSHDALQMNNIVAVTVRGYWVQAGWHPPGGEA
jgi:5-methylcytosine-specific restriction endonuclease McrA